ncbi:glycosyltransferase family 2 protein [Lapidilactobacillus mulanensis]|uniref:Glycosyltransferase family 2 protein n=2 Tax=Lapidilactobacillus mulanensis TaxID=2485999 RepID=A0ABW4DP18_9LACO
MSNEESGVMKLSIIITAYNEEKYIGRCLRALSEQQTRFKYEVIVVNDGSTDNTQRVLTQYVKKFRDIFKPYCKENSGQGLSRNFGIKQSIGEYIGFVDADDWVNQNFVELMCESAQKHNSDIVVCDVHKIYVARMLEEDVTSLEGKKEVVDIANYIRNGQSNSYSCNKIYRRDIWQRYNFKKNGV